MHDGLAQILGYISVKTKTAKQFLAAARIDRVGPELDQVESVAREAHADVRECILGLKSTVSGSRGLLSTLKEYVRNYSLQNGIRAELVIESQMDTAPLTSAAEVQLLRIVQEALTNVRKHSAANRAWVRVSVEDGQFRVIIEDNGQGFQPTVSDGTNSVNQSSRIDRSNVVLGRGTAFVEPG